MDVKDKEILVKEIQNSLIWKALGGLVAVLGLTIVVAQSIVKPPTDEQVEDAVRKVLENDVSLVLNWDANKRVDGNTPSHGSGDKTSYCPAETYAVGVKVHGSTTSQCTGCFDQITVLCQPIGLSME